MELTVTTAKYALVLMSIGGAAAGLNLGVMELTDSPSTETIEEVLLSSGSEPVAQDRLQVVVDVPVVVPDSVVAATLVEPAPEATAGPAKASFSASEEVAAAPVQTTVKAMATGSTVGPAAKAQAVAPSAEGTSAPRSTQPPASSASAPAATEYRYYDFPGVASQIIVAQHPDGSLEFWSVTTESGWSYRVETDTSRVVEVEFSQEPNGEGEAEWSLEYSDGDLRVKKEIGFEDDEDDYDEDDYDEEDDD